MIFQLGSALLDACVLAVLSEEDAYGYSLTQRVKSVLDISESTPVSYTHLDVYKRQGLSCASHWACRARRPLWLGLRTSKIWWQSTVILMHRFLKPPIMDWWAMHWRF